MFLFLLSVDGHLVTERQYCVVVQQHRNYAFAVTKQNCFLDQNGYYIPPFPFVPFFYCWQRASIRTAFIPLLISICVRVRSHIDNVNRLSNIHSGICCNLISLK